MSIVWAFAAARTAANVIASIVAADSAGRFLPWEWVADWAVDGDYTHQRTAAAAARTRIAHLEDEVKTLRGEKALLHLRAGSPL